MYVDIVISNIFNLNKNLFLILPPCGRGVRIQPTTALGSDLYHRPIACRVFLHAMGRMSWDSWALGCPSPGNKLAVPKADEFLLIIRTNGIPEWRSQVTAKS